MKSRLSRMDELEKKCNTLEDRCDSLQRGMKILSKENTWEYSAPAIPTSHWIERGFNLEYIEAMEELVDDIRGKTKAMRKGEHSCRIELAYCDEEEEEEEGDIGFLQYDDALLPHWIEFTTALQLCQNNSLDFTIQNVKITTPVIDLLIPALKGKLQKLFLDNNQFTIREGRITFAVKCMESNHQMKNIYLANNQLGGMENATAVLDAVTRHPSIEHVRLENCLGRNIDGYNILCSLLASDKS